MENDPLKVIVIGDSLVGKTAFIYRYVNNRFRSEYKSTIGVDFSLKIVAFNNLKIKLQLWDIAGQERFTFMTRSYYRGAKASVVIFDLNSETSFEKARKWKQDLDAKIRNPDGSLLPCILIGNKCDLEERQVSEDQIRKMCAEMQFSGWAETSAKDGYMVNEAIQFVVDLAMGVRKREYSSPGNYHHNGKTESVRLDGDHLIRKHNQGHKECLC